MEYEVGDLVKIKIDGVYPDGVIIRKGDVFEVKVVFEDSLVLSNNKNIHKDEVELSVKKPASGAELFWTDIATLEPRGEEKNRTNCTNAPKKCTCEILTLMRNGCQCGGK